MSGVHITRVRNSRNWVETAIGQAIVPIGSLPPQVATDKVPSRNRCSHVSVETGENTREKSVEIRGTWVSAISQISCAEHLNMDSREAPGTKKLGGGTQSTYAYVLQFSYLTERKELFSSVLPDPRHFSAAQVLPENCSGGMRNHHSLPETGRKKGRFRLVERHQPQHAPRGCRQSIRPNQGVGAPEYPALLSPSQIRQQAQSVVLPPSDKQKGALWLEQLRGRPILRESRSRDVIAH